jgi:hypothetical protein
MLKYTIMDTYVAVPSSYDPLFDQYDNRLTSIALHSHAQVHHHGHLCGCSIPPVTV